MGEKGLKVLWCPFPTDSLWHGANLFISKINYSHFWKGENPLQQIQILDTCASSVNTSLVQPLWLSRIIPEVHLTCQCHLRPPEDVQVYEVSFLHLNGVTGLTLPYVGNSLKKVIVDIIWKDHALFWFTTGYWFGQFSTLSVTQSSWNTVGILQLISVGFFDWVLIYFVHKTDFWKPSYSLQWKPSQRIIHQSYLFWGLKKEEK